MVLVRRSTLRWEDCGHNRKSKHLCGVYIRLHSFNEHDWRKWAEAVFLWVRCYKCKTKINGFWTPPAFRLYDHVNKTCVSLWSVRNVQTDVLFWHSHCCLGWSSCYDIWSYWFHWLPWHPSGCDGDDHGDGDHGDDDRGDDDRGDDDNRDHDLISHHQSSMCIGINAQNLYWHKCIHLCIYIGINAQNLYWHKCSKSESLGR